MDIDAFMAEYEQATVVNPEVPSERVYKDVGIVLLPNVSVIALVSIRAMTSHRGDGTRALKWLLSLADRHEVILMGAASAKENVVPDTAALVAWYQKHGFEMLGKYGIRYTGNKRFMDRLEW